MKKNQKNKNRYNRYDQPDIVNWIDMKFREANINDIPGLHKIRMSVKENVLRTPLLVTEAHYVGFLTLRGKGWLCEVDQKIAGFAIVDTTLNNIWALFVLPDFEKKGIGKKLQDIMLDWFFNQSDQTLWLGTAPNTRAEQFYKRSGWKGAGQSDNGEVKFEMTYSDWKKKNS